MYSTYTTITQLKPFSVGLDNFFNFAENFNLNACEDNFPKYNIIKSSDNLFTIEMALAGYSKNDIDIEFKDGALTISHKKLKGETKNDADKYLHRGITKRSFSKSFSLADNVIVRCARFINGLLSIELEQVIPDEKKPKKITID